jgi:hypothetical protein
MKVAGRVGAAGGEEPRSEHLVDGEWILRRDGRNDDRSRGEQGEKARRHASPRAHSRRLGSTSGSATSASKLAETTSAP